MLNVNPAIALIKKNLTKLNTRKVDRFLLSFSFVFIFFFNSNIFLNSSLLFLECQVVFYLTLVVSQVVRSSASSLCEIVLKGEPFGKTGSQNSEG